MMIWACHLAGVVIRILDYLRGIQKATLVDNISPSIFANILHVNYHGMVY